MSDRKDSNKKIVEEFRANAGKVSGYFAGKTMLILHSRGAKSGREHVNPVMYVKDGDRWVVIASKGGADTNPNWYYNLLANPLVTIEVGTEKYQARASLVDEEPERTRLYDKMVAMMPSFDDYRRKTKRKIPVFVLTPLK
jgi:deazaflavin-dependent oxidoreductase (nitroreductase family)